VTDGRTDRQICRGYYSGLHCEQCGGAVNTENITTVSDTTVLYQTLNFFIISHFADLHFQISLYTYSLISLYMCIYMYYRVVQ